MRRSEGAERQSEKCRVKNHSEELKSGSRGMVGAVGLIGGRGQGACSDVETICGRWVL